MEKKEIIEKLQEIFRDVFDNEEIEDKIEKIEETSFNKAVSVRAKRTGNTEKQCADELCEEYNAVLESIDNKVERLRSMIRRDKESGVISSEVKTAWEPKLC